MVNDLGAQEDGTEADVGFTQKVVNEIIANGGEAIDIDGDVSDYDSVGNHEWCRAVGAKGRLAWATDDGFTTEVGRLDAQDDFDAAITERTRQEAYTALQSLGVPAGPIELKYDVFAEPHVSARGFLRENSGSSTGAIRIPDISGKWKWNGADMKVGTDWWPGRDNEYANKEVLGFSDEQHAQAERDGSISLRRT